MRIERHIILRKSQIGLACFVQFLVCLLSIFSHAQIPLENWRAHSSYRSAKGMEVVENRVYCFSKNGFFSVNLLDNQTKTFSKIDGLAENGITAIAYSKTLKKLLLGYENGMIDLASVDDDGDIKTIENLPLIKQAEQLLGSKAINYMAMQGQDTYLATNFGIVRLDLARSEIKETYKNIGEGGQQLAVKSIAFTTDSVAILTANGLKMAPYAVSVNLQDFVNWRAVAPPETAPLTQMTAIGTKIYAAIGSKLWTYEKGHWTLLQNYEQTIQYLSVINSQIVVSTSGNLFFQNGNKILEARLNNITAIKNSSDGVFWVTNNQNGLLKFQNNQWTETLPNGLQKDTYQRVLNSKNQIVATTFNEVGVDIFENQKWIYSNASFLPPTIQNVTDLSTDKQGNVWITTSPNGFSSPNLFVRKPDGSTQSFIMPRRQLTGLAIDDNGYKWLKVSEYEGGGILVFDDKNNQTKFLTAGQNVGNLPSNVVSSLTKDRDGAIWAGTDRGVAVFDNTTTVFSNNINAYTPIFERKKLLVNEFITSIGIDGGNNKWIGTKNGLFRFSPDGTALLDRFVETNSPLPSNQIIDIAIEPQSGEVFINTPKGVVSYQSTANEAEQKLSKISIFPNPIRPEFNGTVGIKGLTENGVVKITDLSGRLVYETRSQGGMVSWNLLDYQGRRQQTGIYLVLVADPNGQEAIAGKLAIVN